jgi:hypothetical protein
MKWRAMLCGLVVGACVLVVTAPTAVGTGCGPGYEEGVGTEYDTDGDGFVCVNQETGAVTDDVDAQQGTTADRNNDGILCVKPTQSGSVVTTDNNSSHEENFGCPPGFQPSPVS